MGRLPKIREEAFCQIIAKEDCDPSYACWKAGYGKDNHPHQDSYHVQQSTRLMSRKHVILRIEEIRDNISLQETDFKGEMIDFLKKAVFYDPTKYLKVKQVDMENGTVAQQVLIREQQFSNWDALDRQMIDHFDPKTGNPIFVSKQWAGDKLLKIIGLDGGRNTNTEDIENVMTLFRSAGLTVGLGQAQIGTTSPEDEDEDEEE